MNNEAGQSLIEVIVAVTVGILVVSALTFATIFSLRNASFAKNSAQATKLAQEGIEKVRTIRDRDGSVIFTAGNTTTSKFSDLWGVQMSTSCTPCYFSLSNGLNPSVAANFDDLGNGLQRQIQISEEANVDWRSQKKITVVVKWSDFAGSHESKLVTILRRL
ncbi:MAG: prepilin-type N-terminal cleavage/methylation domain-containing protein [Candidatus Daviesbacteria bacterium]|nr:prepilin-type N-terminal cleavage/methylation domain-containing protein [Candidatus Daviesbacteria bacterium]